MKRMLLAVGAFGLLAFVAGCSEQLETGYNPRPLDASDITRRGFYASPYTREAKAAEAERERDPESRRQRPGY